MRQLERVRAYPRGDDVVVEVVGFGETADAFYVALSGDLAPLDHVARFVPSGHWMRALQSPRQRHVLWSNMRRLAIALGAVHGQGLVHGRIDRRAIFTSGAASEADFRLGGFEFCLRIADVVGAPVGVIAKSRPVDSLVFSFLDDWRALGLVTVELLGLDKETLFDEEPAFLDGRAQVDLRAVEVDLLRLLLRPERNRALDAHVVVTRLDDRGLPPPPR
jgi:hypothetical protein